jgi:Zn-dependent M28 family amino/carboxypeptidase
MRAATPLGVEVLAAPASLTGVDFSDHASYWDAGYHAVMITDTAFFRNPHYHTATDTPDRLDYARMAQVVQGLRAAVLALAQ